MWDDTMLEKNSLIIFEIKKTLGFEALQKCLDLARYYRLAI